MVNSFSRFVQGKVIMNKWSEKIVKVVTDIWILCFGILSVCFYANIRGGFVNMKMDELIAKLGITVRYGPD